MLLYRVMAGVAAVIVLVLAYAVFATYVQRPNEELAKVGNVSITRSSYEKLRRYDLFQQLRTSQFLQTQGASSTSGIQSPDVLQQQLNTVSTDPVDSSTVYQMVDNEVLKQKAQSDFKIAASNDDLKTAAVKDFIPSPTPPTTPAPSATISSTTNITPTATATFTPGPPTNTPTKTATLPPVPGASATAAADYKSAIVQIESGAKISEQDYLNLVVQPNYLKGQVTDKVGATVMTTTEAIHAQHILTDTEAGAQKIITMLNQGEDFTKLANVQSSEQITRTAQHQPTNGGDLGWFSRDGTLLDGSGSTLDAQFVDGAWPVPAGQYTKTPVHTQFGWHVIKVIERNQHFALSDTEIQTLKDKAYTDWFNKAKDSMSASIKYSDKVPQPTPVPTQPAIAPPTAAPAGTTPTAPTGGAAPPAGSTPTEPGVTPTAKP